MERIKTYFRNIQPFALLAGGLLLVASISAGLGLWHHQLGAQTESQPAATVDSADSRVSNPNSSQPKTKSPAENNSSNNQANSQTSQAQIAGSNTQNYEDSSTATTHPSTNNNNDTSTNNTSSSSSAICKQHHNPKSDQSLVTVTLTVYNRGTCRVTGPVHLYTSSNQCDVLRQALNDGMISSLEMRREPHGMGVYVIDSIGDSQNIWWVYSVDGQSPPSCDKTPVNEGDDIDWNYIK